MEKISITVIVPIYNTGLYLEECLNSIVGQSYSDFQIILVDDGSTDGCEKICDKYAQIDSRIKVIHQKNSGLVNARKTGLKEADGDYIYYVDSDDWLDKNIIENFVNILRQYTIDIITIGCKREYSNGNCFVKPALFKDGLYDKEKIRNELLPRLINTNQFFEFGQEFGYWLYLIKKELLVNNLKNIADEIRMGEDVVCTYPCLLDAENIYIKSNIYYHYRQNSTSMKKTIDDMEYLRLQLLYRRLIDRFLEEEERDILIKKAKYLIIFYLLILSYEKLQSGESPFPYMNFEKGKKVVVYGAGIFGNKIVEWINYFEYADIVAWVDGNYAVYQNQEKPVVSPEILNQIEYDYIILGILKAEMRKSVRDILRKKHVRDDKIVDIDLNKINNIQLPEEFEIILQKAMEIKKISRTP